MAALYNDVPMLSQPRGSLAAERYLLYHWDPNSSESSNQQRERLLKTFVGAAPKRIDFSQSYTTPPITPPETPISPVDSKAPVFVQTMEIPVEEESVAESATIPTIWLRTCYSSGSDTIHQNLIGSAKLFEGFNDKHHLLDNSSVYNFGDDWDQVFDAFPQLLEPDCGNWKERQQEARETLTRFRQTGSASAPSGDVEHLSYIDDAEMGEYVAQALQSDVHKAFVVSRIVLADDESMATGEVAVMFVDAFGRVVRQKRISAEAARQMDELSVDAQWDDMEEWEEAELGEEYEVGGLCEDLLVKR